MLLFFLGHLGEGGERAIQKYLGAHSSLVLTTDDCYDCIDKVGLSFHTHLTQEASAGWKVEHYLPALLTVYEMTLQFFKAKLEFGRKDNKRKNAIDSKEGGPSSYSCRKRDKRSYVV